MVTQVILDIVLGLGTFLLNLPVISTLKNMVATGIGYLSGFSAFFPTEALFVVGAILGVETFIVIRGFVKFV